MKEITLTQGQVAKVCDCCAHKVEGYKWCADWKEHTQSYYAVRNSLLAERLLGAPSKILMHAVINGTPKGIMTDHRNHDTLDNQCSNLRNATYTQNQQNTGKKPNNTSGFKGVSWDKQHKKWRARIVVNGVDKNIGYFDTPELAAKAVDLTAREHFGEFAHTNF